MCLCRHQAGCDLVSALAQQSGRKCKPGVWLQKVFPFHFSKCPMPGEQPHCSLLIHCQVFACSAHLASYTAQTTTCPDPCHMGPGLKHCTRQRHARHSSLSLWTQINGDGKHTVQTHFPLNYPAILTTGRSDSPAGLYDAQALHWQSWHIKKTASCSCPQRLRNLRWWTASWESAKQMLEVAHGSRTLPQSLTWRSAMQQCRCWQKPFQSCRTAPVAPEQDVLWSQNGPGTCQILVTCCFHKELKKV